MAQLINSNRVDFRPFALINDILRIAEDVFGLRVDDRSSVKELESYDDRNFLLEGRIYANDEITKSPLRKYVLKVMHPKNTYTKGILEAIVKAVEHLKRREDVTAIFSFPENVHGLNGDVFHLEEFRIPLEYIAGKDGRLYEKITKGEAEGDHVWKTEKDEKGEIYINIKLYVRLLVFLPGKSLITFDVTDDVLFHVGVLAGTLSKELEDFAHPFLIGKQDIWDVKNLQMLNNSKYLDCIPDEKKKNLIMIALDLFEKKILPIGDKLPHQSIHSDINEGNVIVENKNGSPRVEGLIDFGDITHSYRVLEIGIAIAYMSLLRPNDCVTVAGIVLSGYLSVSSLNELEHSVLYYCVISRLAQSLILGNFSYLSEPANEYVLNSSKNGFQVLETFLSYRNNVKEIYDIWSKN